jgi:hypothetical protein
MDTKNNEAKVKSHRIWDWILVILGGLFTLSGLCLMVIFISSAPSDISQYLFSALLLMIGVLLLFIGFRLITRKDKKISKIISIGGAVAVLVLAGIFCVSVLSYKTEGSPPQNPVITTTSIQQATYTSLPTYTPYPTNTFIPPPTNTSGPTNTPLPTSSPTATFTSSPTSTRTPIPTATLPPTRTPIPAILLYDIYDNFKHMTEYQFSVYKDEIAGKPVRENIIVGNVDDNGRIVIAGPWSENFFNLYDFCMTVTGVPSEIAVTLNSGDLVYLDASINRIVGNWNYYYNCENTLVLVYGKITEAH